jgi:hypothetical protein
MIALPDFVLWIGATLLAGYVAALSWRLGRSRDFPFLSLYLVVSAFIGLSRFLVLTRLGLWSEQYHLLYHYSDSVLALLLYAVIMELYRKILPAHYWRLLRRGFLALLFLVALSSHAAVWRLDIHAKTTTLAYTVSQNLFIVSLALTLLLWIIVRWRNHPQEMAFRMIQVWGVYFLLLAGMYVLAALHLDSVVPQMAEVWLPLGLGFAIVSGSRQELSPRS